jgi:hypothetical protein
MAKEYMGGVKNGGGATHFAGGKVGVYDEKVHGKGSESKPEGETRVGEKKSSCTLHEKHYAHIR